MPITARLVISVALALCAFGANAATYTPTRLDDPFPAPCTATNCSLRGAVAVANAHLGNDTIQLGVGEYKLSAVNAFGIGAPLTVSDRLAIVGAGSSKTSIRQTLQYRVFTVQSTLFALTNLAMQGGRANTSTSPGNSGGCVYSDHGSMTFTGTAIGNCIASDLGGAVYLNGGRLVLSATSIELNLALRGGAIAMGDLDSNVALRDGSQLFRNTANTGGALYSQTGTVIPSGSTAHPGVLSISSNSLISANKAGYGGALAIAFGKGLNASLDAADLADSSALGNIVNNKATNGSGGAVFSQGQVGLSRLRLANNTAAYGGAIHFERGSPIGGCPSVFLSNSEIANNQATIDGGGLWGTEGSAFIANVSFNANAASNTGGAIWYRSGDFLTDFPCDLPLVSLTNASISNNTATYGAGIHVPNHGQEYSYATIDLKYSTFFNNHASAFQNASDVQVENWIIPSTTDMTENSVYTDSTIYTGGCFYGPFAHWHSNGGNRDASPVPTCGSSMPGDLSVPGGFIGLAYGAFGGPFSMVGITSPFNQAIDGGTSASCPPTDARGAPRHSDSCDSGAFEFDALVP